MSRMSHRSIDGSLRQRVALMRRARAADAEIRWPFRLPHAKGRDVAAQIEFGAGAYVGRQAWININSTTARLRIGEGSVIGNDLTVTCGGLVDVGPGVLMSARVCLLDQLHDYDDWMAAHFERGAPARFSWAMTEARPVIVGEGTWLGINVVVLPGVTIGKGCIVGANSVVTKHLPDYSVAAGAPARILRSSKRETSRIGLAGAPATRV
jgi:acetyltransferase-like isoleucine patch superfamily enzyme